MADDAVLPALQSNADASSLAPDSPQLSRLNTAIQGCLWGTVVGDALGLPMEGLSRQRQARMFPDLTRYHFLFGRGMVSDDTEHTWMVAKALLVSGGEPEVFGRSLARQMRWWLIGVPAGIGLATLKAILRLWLGVPYTRSGVFSAGNGPAMRSALLGVYWGHDLSRLCELARRIHPYHAYRPESGNGRAAHCRRRPHCRNGISNREWQFRVFRSRCRADAR